MRVLLVCLLLVACTRPEAVPPLSAPAELQLCPKGAPPPPSLPGLITPEKLRAWAIATDAAYRHTLWARDTCAASLAALVHWIETGGTDEHRTRAAVAAGDR
jgi:hypothetical protein